MRFCCVALCLRDNVLLLKLCYINSFVRKSVLVSRTCMICFMYNRNYSLYCQNCEKLTRILILECVTITIESKWTFMKNGCGLWPAFYGFPISATRKSERWNKIRLLHLKSNLRCEDYWHSLLLLEFRLIFLIN